MCRTAFAPSTFTSIDHDAKYTFPRSAFVAGSKLLVVDAGNNRVLVWNSIPTSSGQPADLVLGQTALDRCSVNGGAAGTCASGLFAPSDVWTDSTRLLVVDTGRPTPRPRRRRCTSRTDCSCSTMR